MPCGEFEAIWPVPPPKLALISGEVHVWRIALIQDQAALQSCRGLLSHEEAARADRFHFAKDRDHFVVAHCALRQILALYLRVRPKESQFTQQKYGKPELAPECNPLGLTFNLSHSGEVALLAVAARMQLGVDVELVRSDFGGEEIAERFFSRSEVEKLRLLPADQHTCAFFQCWTRKEAYIKARGEGLSIPLESFDVAFARGETPALLAVGEHPSEASRWSVYNLQPREGYAAALVAEGNGHELKRWTWKNCLQYA